jgi:hypothetical protein
MPLFLLALIKWLAGAIASLAAFFVTFIGKKLAMVAAAITVMIGLTTAVWLALQGVVNGVSASMPAGITTAAGWIIPGNLPECAAAIISAKVIRFAYDFKMTTTKMRAL